MSRESLARIPVPQPEEIEKDTEIPAFPAANDNEPLAANDNLAETAPVILHPEVANDNEPGQPISTIYPETAPTIAANDNEQIAEVQERLAKHARESAAVPDEDLEVPPVRPEQFQEASAAESTPGHSESPVKEAQTAQAAGGARRKDSEGGSTSGSNTGGVERKKGILGKIFGKMWGFAKGIVKGIYNFGAFILGAVVWAEITLVRKATEQGFKRLGFKDDGKGAKPAEKAPAHGGGGHGGGHGGGGHH